MLKIDVRSGVPKAVWEKKKIFHTFLKFGTIPVYNYMEGIDLSQ